MSTLVAKKLVTAEEFLHWPEPVDGSRQELVRGEVITVPPPGFVHGACCLRLGRKIGNFVDDNRLGVAVADSGFITERNPDTVRGPDISFWKKDRLPEVPAGYIDVPPDLAVEVVSPSDVFSKVQRKVRHYLDRGVAMVWVVDPEEKTVTVYRSRKDSAFLAAEDEIDGGDVLPGFRMRVADLFS